MRNLYLVLRILAICGTLFFMGMKVAHAQNATQSGYATRSAAFSACLAEANPSHFGQGTPTNFKDATCHDDHPLFPGAYGTKTVVGCTNRTYDTCNYTKAFKFTGGDCPNVGDVWNTTTHTCQNAQADAACAAKGDMNGIAKDVASSGNLCVGSCSYFQSAGIGGTGPDGKYNRNGTFTNLGAACTSAPGTTYEAVGASPAEKAESCIPIGSLSQCFNPSTNKMCAVTPRGNKACWSITENNTKVSQDQKEALAKAVAPTVPAAPATLVNAETATSTTTTQPTPGATVTNITNNIVYSNTTGQAGTGTTGSTSSGTATGSTPGTGTAGGTSGGSTDGEGAGSCDGTGDCTNSGDAGGVGGSGDLYDAETETFNDTWTAFKADIEGTAIVGAVDSFFSVTTSGTCPVITLPSSQWWDGVSSDMLCVGATADIMGFIGYFMLSLAAFTAVKWALMY